MIVMITAANAMGKIFPVSNGCCSNVRCKIILCRVEIETTAYDRCKYRNDDEFFEMMFHKPYLSQVL